MYAYPGGEPAGNEDAFAIMCERYRSRLVAFCHRRLRTSHDAEDIAHETLLRAYHAMPGFDPSNDAWPWLRTIAARVCTDIERRTARAPGPPSVDEHTDDVHDQVVARLRADILDDAIGQLPPRYRMPLLLREYGGWSYDDIARTQGKSLASVRSILTRSRRRLGSNVESVARARGQWPLPGVVPPMQRLRAQVRAWRETLDRSSYAIGGVFDLSSMATRWAIGANATMASVLGLSTTMLPVVPPSPAPTSTKATSAFVLDVKESRVVHASSSLAVVNATATASPGRETLGRFETTASTPAHEAMDMEPTRGVVEIDSTEDSVWVRDHNNLNAPVIGPVADSGETRVPCAWTIPHTLTCTALRTLATYSEQK